MNRAETAQLLTMIAAYDQRTIGESDVIAWHGALGDLHLSECQTAVAKHHSQSLDRCKPAHLRHLVTALRQDAAMREIPAPAGLLITKPDWFDSSVAEHRRRTAERNAELIAAGQPPQYGEAVVLPIDRRQNQNSNAALRDYWNEVS